MVKDVPENIYGHGKRLRWIARRVRKGQVLVELGCGTGYMITLPLLKMGFNAYGVDLDKKSIAYGKRVFRKEGADAGRLKAQDLSDLRSPVQAVIASEVLEHIPDRDLPGILAVIRRKLPKRGKLLVTVPNGYGWFELESFLWFKAGLGRWVERLYIGNWVRDLKKWLIGRPAEEPYHSTLSDSPHVQRFTYFSIRRLLRSNGFRVAGGTGSVLFAGPFSNLFFSGLRPFMWLNNLLGSLFPWFASGFFLDCEKDATFKEAQKKR